MKRLLIAVAIFLAALLAAGVAARFLIDWEGVQQDLLARAGRSVGLQVSFDGDIEFELLPRPALRIDGVRIGPAAGQGDQTIVAAETVEIEPSLTALLGGRIEVKAVALSGVSVALERDAAGRGNWETLLDAIGQGESEDEATTVATEIRIARGTVFFQDRAAGREETIGAIAGRIKLPGEFGSYELDLAFLWRGVALSLNGLAAQPSAEGVAPFDLALRDADLGSLRLSGQADIPAGRVGQGRIQVESKDAGMLLARLGSGGIWPASMRKLQLTGRFAVDASGATFDDLRLKLGDATASGGVLVKFGAQPRIDAAFTLPQLTLDPLLAVVPAVPDSNHRAGSTWPGGIAAHLAMEIGAASYRGSAIRDVKLDAALSDGKLRIDRLEGTAPGGTAIEIAGRIEKASEPRLQGKLGARSNNLRAFLGWLGVDLDEIAATRLRRAGIAATLTIDGRGLVLDQAKADVDSSTLNGRIEIPWDDAADIDVALEIDRLDLDAYRQPPAASAGERPPAPSRGVTGRIAIAQATFDSRLFKAVAVDGRWHGAEAELRSFAAQAPGAADLRGSGKVEEIGRAARFTGRVQLASREPGGLVRWLGFQPSPGLDGLQAFALSAEITASEHAVTASAIEASLGDLHLTGSAGIDLAGERPHVTADMKIPSWRVPWEAGAAPALDAPRPVDFHWLTGFDADLRVAAEELHALHYTLYDARAVATIRENAIELKRLTGRAYDGWLRARGRLDASGDQVRYTASVEGGDLAIEPLLIDAAEFGELSGKLHLAVEVKGAGTTDAELIRSADGSARIVATDGLIRGFDMGRIAKRVARLENITDIGKLIDAVEEGGQTRFTLMQGELSIASGIARSDNIELRIEGGSGKANGWVDLAASTVSLRGEVTIDEAPGKPTIGIVARGTLEEPEREIKTGELSRYIQQRINDAAMGKAAAPSEAEVKAAVPHTIELPKPPRRFRKQATQ